MFDNEKSSSEHDPTYSDLNEEVLGRNNPSITTKFA